jgi:hypothetical protein
MSKSVRSFLSLLVVLQLIIPYSIFAAATGEFKSVVGDVTQTRAKEVIKPVVKSPIQPKDIIITDKASSAMMVFPDNSMVKLEQNSKLEINEFIFKEKSRTAIFFLSIGKVAVNVSKFIGGDNIYEVHSPTATLGVRGTGFEFDEAINAENKNMATVSCEEGSLNLSALSPTGAVVSTAVLEAGQMAVIIGGVITISAIGAVGAAAGGLSTGAKVGIAAAAIAGAGGVAAVTRGGGGGGGVSTPAPTPAPTPVPTPTTAPLSFRLYENSSDDFDMIVTKPNGTVIHFYDTSEYSQDSVAGSGPDIAYWQSPLRGTYSIQVECYYNQNSGVTKNVSLEVWQNGVKTATLASFTVPGNTANNTIVASYSYVY